MRPTRKQIAQICADIGASVGFEESLTFPASASDTILLKIHSRSFWLMNERSGGEVYISEVYWFAATGHFARAVGEIQMWRALLEDAWGQMKDCPWPLASAAPAVVEYRYRFEAS
jgi:hypothetical protein